MGKHRAVVVVTLALLCAPACLTEGPSGPSPQPRPSSTARLGIVAPVAGEKVEGETVGVKVTLEGAEVVEETTSDLRPDEGHLHVSIDGRVVSMTFGLEQEVPVEKGRHVLTVEFVAGDHVPFEPRVIATTTFEVV